MKGYNLKRVLSFTLSFSLAAAMSGCGKNDTQSDTVAASTTADTTSQTSDTEIKETEKAIDPDLIITPESVSIDTSIVVSPLNASTNNGGKFEGWGTSLCWWANRLGYSDTLAQKSADLFYGDDGLRMNIMRYNIGGGDDPTHTHITRTDSAVPGWLVWDEEAQDYIYDYDADHNQLNVMERAVKAAGDSAIVEVFSNSPPYFMTVSGCSSGGTDSNQNNLKDESYKEFADYLAQVTKYIQEDMGISVTSVSPMNEPNTNYWGAYSYKQEGCHFDAGDAQSEIIVETAAALQKYGLSNVMVVASDETSTAKQIEEYHTYSDEAKNVIGRINTHTYDTSKIGELGQLAKDENFKLWMSEVDGAYTAGTNAGEMGSALWFGGKIISDINALSPSAWVMWQAIDNHISEDGYNGRTDSGMVDVNDGFWGLAVADHDNEEIILTQKYYAMGQFTRYIRPGYTIISCGANSLAAYDKENGKLTVVVLNTEASDKTANIDLSQFKSIGSTVNAVRTSGTIENGEHWAKLDDIYTYASGFVAELKANSITTFTLENVEAENISIDEITVRNASVIGSEPWNNGKDIAENVIDGNIDTFFDGVSNGWLEIDLGEKIEFNVIGYAPRIGFESRMLDGRFYGSNDGENWNLICTVTASPTTGINYAFLNMNCNFRYIRYDVPDGDSYCCNISEIRLFKTDSENVSGGNIDIDTNSDTVTKERTKQRVPQEQEEISYTEISLANAVVIGSDPWNNGSDTAEKVIDGNLDSFFDGVADGWPEIDLGKETEFDVIGFAPRSDFESRMTEGRFYGSNDGENWTELYHVAECPSYGMNYIEMQEKCTYRYIRYDVPSGTPAGSSDPYCCNIAEIKLLNK